MGCMVKSSINIHCRGDRIRLVLCDIYPCGTSEDLQTCLLLSALERQYWSMGTTTFCCVQPLLKQ